MITRAEKTAAVKELFRELLTGKSYKRTELIDEAARLYTQRFPSGETENVNDVKGRMGSVFNIMKEEDEITSKDNLWSLKKAKKVEKAEKAEEAEKPVKAKKETKKTKAVKADKKEVAPVEGTAVEAVAEEKKAKTEKATKTEKVKKTATKKKPLPAQPVLPIAPVAPTTPETQPEVQPVTPDSTEELVAAPAPKKRGRKKAEVVLVEPVKAETVEKKPTEEKPKKRAVRAKKKTEEPIAANEEINAQPVAVEGGAEEKTPAVSEEKPVLPAEVKSETKSETKEEIKAVKEETKPEEKAERKAEEKLEEKTEQPVKKALPVFDMTLLFGDKKPIKKAEEKPQTKSVPSATSAAAEKPASTPIVEEKKTETPAKSATQALQTAKTAKTEKAAKEVKTESAEGQTKPEKTEQPAPVSSPTNTPKNATANAGGAASKTRRIVRTKSDKPLTADEALREAYLKKLRSLGGDYFEYYSVYLLERYSMKNGRRLEGLRISGGDHDGGIDGEIELTDRLGFRETIYIQAKNWNPDKGDERLWVVGETLLQQFIGACLCRQVKEGKQHSRGIFITTSRFTAEAKRLLDEMSDKIVGYDGNDLYEAAKECSFGLVRKNGNWTLDEELLSGEKAFFNML